MKQYTNFSVAGGLQNNTSDADSQPTQFVVLRNALPDRRIGAIVKRRGSQSASVAGGLGVPLGAGNLELASAASLIPHTGTRLFNFAGSAWYKLSGTTYSSVSKSSNTSFGSTRPTMFDQLGPDLFIAGGRPAYWDGTNNIERVGIPAPTGTITTGSSLTGITGTFTYMFTFYNSTTGLESDWSPESAEVTVSNKQVDLTIPGTLPSGNADKIRIYRTLDGGAQYYLLTTQNTGTTSYADTTTDITLQANSIAAPSGDYGVPPTTSYLVQAYNARNWWVDADNPYKLVYSEAYSDAAPNNGQYYPTNNFIIFDEIITGLIRIPGRLLVFHPRSISSISGFSAEDFVREPFLDGLGTVFPQSVASNGREVVFLSEEGLVSFSGEGTDTISRPIDIELREVMDNNYNSDLYVSSVWSPHLKQFLFLITGRSTVGAPWSDATTGALAQWEDASTGDMETWEDSTSPGSEETLRIKMWGWSPELNLFTEYLFPYAEDLNADGAHYTFLFHPAPSSDTLNPQQSTTYMGYYDGTAGDVLELFHRDKQKDDATNITALAITGRINVGDPNLRKLYQRVMFKGSYADPATNGATLKYFKDFDDPQLGYTATDLKDFSGSGDEKRLSEPTAKHIHLYVEDATDSAENIIMQDFGVQWRPRKTAESR